MSIDQLISLIRNPETKDKGASELNAIIHETYHIHLVTCPQCGMIHSFIPNEYNHTHTCTCETTFNQSEAPDLFY